MTYAKGFYEAQKNQTDPLDDPEALAQLFHETYERLAPNFGYETRKDSAVPWAKVPDKNRALMTMVASHILSAINAEIAKAVRDRKYELLNDLLEWEKQWRSIHTEPFNWYGAIKAMQVMKDPQKPFTQLKESKNE